MRKFLSLLLAVMLCCTVFVSCGKAEQEPEVSPEPSVEVAEGKFSDEDIEEMKKHASEIVLTQEDRDYLVEFAMKLVPIPAALSSISDLCKSYAEGDEWKNSVQTLSAQMRETYESAKALTPTDNCKELYDLAMAGLEAAVLAAEKIGVIEDENDPILSLASDYFEICNKYIDAATEYMKIVLESQPAPDVPLEVTGIALDQDSIGTTEISLMITNTGEVGIDAVQLRVEFRDAYEETVKIYGAYSYATLSYEDMIEPGKSTPSDWVWTMTGVDGIKTMRVAVQKYHTTDGNTVTINDAQLKWSEWIG